MAGKAPSPVYVIYGSDEFLRSQYKSEMTSEALGDADPQMCMTEYDSSAELASVLDDLRTLPLLGSRRLVVVDRADDFISAHRQALEEYLASPCPTTSLMLLPRSFPGNTRLAKVVARIGVKADCAAPNAGKVASFIRDGAKSLGRQIDPPAADLMIQWLGNDLARVQSELAKLALYTEGRPTITVEDVSAVVVATAGITPWVLSDALAAGDVPVALDALDRLLTRSGEEYRVLGLIGWHLRRVLKAKQMQAAGRGEGEILKAVKVFGAGRAPFQQLLARCSLHEVCSDFRELIRADLAIKTGRNGKAALQCLVVALCRPINQIRPTGGPGAGIGHREMIDKGRRERQIG